MEEFDSLLQRLLDSSPDLDREDIMTRIKEKKHKIGAGYLTDQGALFLVASDLGIQISEPLSNQISLKELYAGAKDVTLDARVMTISPPQQYSRRDGTNHYRRTMLIYDADTACQVSIWDDHAKDDILDQLAPGDTIKITGAYIKSDIRGDCVVNLGEGSEVSAGSEMPSIPGIDKIAKDAEDLEETDRNVVITGLLDGMITTMNFTRKSGQPSSALRMRLKGRNGSNYRVVIWGQNDSDIPKMIPVNASVKLIGVHARKTNSGLEIHGSEATMVDVASHDSQSPLVLRVLSLSQGDRGSGMILCVNKDKTLYFVTDESDHHKACREDGVVELVPTKTFGQYVILGGDSYLIPADDDGSIPRRNQLRTRLADTDIGGSYCIEVVVLQDPEIRDIQTRSGESIQLLEMHVGDDTDQMWLKGWRTQARLASNCKVGDRLSITGLNARQGLEGRIDLVLSAYSSINPITDSKTS